MREYPLGEYAVPHRNEAARMLALIGKKIGMTQLFNEEGMRIPLSVIQVEPNVVVRERTAEKNGYSAMVLGADPLKKTRVRKPYAGQFPEGTDPTRFLLEFKDFEKECKVGDKRGRGDLRGRAVRRRARHHQGQGLPGRRASGTSSPGGPGAHGSKFHREMGSVGTGAFRKIIKGSKMPGRMGNAQLTVQNLRLFRVDKEKGLLLINGAVPGRRGGMVVVLKARKK